MAATPCSTTSTAAPDSIGTDVRIAACALLLEIAYADHEFSVDERRHVEATLSRQFGVTPTEAARLVRSAEAARDAAPGPWCFTNAIVERFSRAQRVVLSRILHGLSGVDGDPSWEEAYAVQKISAMLRVEPVYA